MYPAKARSLRRPIWYSLKPLGETGSKMDFVCVCVRIPKCGSTSLANMLSDAFSERQMFYMPHTLNPDASTSIFQEMRFLRSQSRNLFRLYKTLSLRKAFKIIAERAKDGDLINGGHIDFPTVRKNISRKAKMITLMREPATRCRSEYEYCRDGYLKRGHLQRFDSGARHKAAAKYSFDGFLDYLDERRDTLGNVAANYMGWDGEEDLDTFHANNVFHSGVLEKVGQFQQGLSEKMGRCVQMPRKNFNRSGTEAEISHAQRRKIEKIYPRDFQLYEWQLARC